MAVGAVAGVFLGAGLQWFGVGQRPLPRLRRAPPGPSILPAPPPEVAPSPPAFPGRLTSLVPPTREEVAWLQLHLKKPARMRITLQRSGRPDQVLFDAGERRSDATVALAPLPPSLQATLVLAAPEWEEPHRIPVRGRPAQVQERTAEGPPLQGLGSGADAAYLLLGTRDLRRVPDDGAAPQRHESPLELRGEPFLRRGRVLVAGPGRDVRAFDAATLEPRWRARLPGPARWPPLLIEPFQLAFLSEGPSGPVLQCLEASRGVPMWTSPRTLAGSVPEGSYPKGGGRRLLVPVAPSGLQVWSLFGDEVATDLAQVVAGTITAPVATSPREWRAAVGSATGRVRTLDLLSRRTLRDQGHPPGNELLPAEIHAQPSLLPVRRLHFLDLHRLLVMTDKEFILLNAAGGVNWRVGLPARPVLGPVVVPGRILLGLSNGTLLHLSRIDGEVLEAHQGPPLVAGSLGSPTGPTRWGRTDGRHSLFLGGGFPAVPGVESGPLAPTPATDSGP